MALTYEESRDRIMMDHLSPESPSMKNFKSFYVPDMSYDAFVLDGSKWVLNEDVIGTNPDTGQERNQTVLVMNPETGQPEEEQMRSEWINPEDMDAPAGGSEHVAVTPESAAEDNEAVTTDPNAPAVDPRDRRDPSNLSTVQGNKKKKKRNRRKRGGN